MTKNFLFTLAVIFGLGTILCTTSGCDYYNREINYDVNLDSLFFGLKFGDKRQEFYDKCWDLNKKKIVKQGTYNTSVMYVFEERFGKPVEMNFYPKFENERVHIMDVMFHHPDWAPWAKEYQSPVLQEKVITLLSEWYDIEFEDKGEGEKKIYYSIDYPRRIVVENKENGYVSVEMLNLKYGSKPKTKNKS